MSIKTLRSMIHAGEMATREARATTEKRERNLATEACAALYATFDDESNVAALRKLVSCARRLASLSAARWGMFAESLEKIFHFGLDSGAANA